VNSSRSSISGAAYPVRPFVRLINVRTDALATARAILNEDGAVVHVTRGLAPLGAERRGDDVMLTDALAFDLRVYDPGAPMYGYYPNGDQTLPADQIVEPIDPAWAAAFTADVPGWLDPTEVDDPLGAVGDLVARRGRATQPFRFEGRGAYVDLGYGKTYFQVGGSAAGAIADLNRFVPLTGNQARLAAAAQLDPLRFFRDGLIRVATGAEFTTHFATYDTWTSHYETNGINEDLDNEQGDLLASAGGRPAIDEGANGLDDPTTYRVDFNGNGVRERDFVDTRLGPDDPDERETSPPYDTAVRGLQVTLRVYERDSRQVRESTVTESFVPE